MGRARIEIKRLEDEAKAKVTFSKRRDGLLKKAKELAILCDVDVAVIAFSPSGKLVQFCNRSIEDVIGRFDLSHARQEKIFQMNHCSDVGNLSTLRDQVGKLQAELSASKELSGMLWGDEVCLQRLNLAELERLGAQLRESHQKVLNYMGCLRSYGVPAGSCLNVQMAAETCEVSALTHQGVEPRHEVEGSGTEQSSSTLHGAEANGSIEAITGGSGTGHMYSASQLEADQRQYSETLMEVLYSYQAGTSSEEESEGSEAITELTEGSGARSGASQSLQEWQDSEQLLQDPCADPEEESEGSEAIAEGSGAGHMCSASQSLQEWQNFRQLLLQVPFPDPTGSWEEDFEGSEAITEGSGGGHDMRSASQSLQEWQDSEQLHCAYEAGYWEVEAGNRDMILD